MKLTDTTLDGLVVIAIEGDLDHSNIGVLNEVLDAHMSNGNYCLLVDLERCSYIDSAGLGAMMNLLRTVQGKGTLAVAAPSPHIRRVLDIAGLPGTEGFHVYDDLATGRAAHRCPD